MARGVNKVMLIGNLGRDPETRYTQGGTPITSFSVATSESWKDRQSGEQQDRTEWHNVVCFSKLAEIAGEYLHKGSKVYIEGSLRTSNWERDGQKHYKTEIIANNLQMLDSRGGGGGGGEGYSEPAAQAQDSASGSQFEPASGADDFDDDIPF